MRIVFLGTPDFGIPALKRLQKEGHEILCVVTQPDRPQGRKMVLTPCAMKQAAQEAGLPVFSPEKINSEDSLAYLSSLAPDVMVTAAYGQILRRKILSMAPYGIVNIHGSLLPRYRGAAPIQWALIDGEKETGVTTMQTERGVDTGAMLITKKIPISDKDTAETLFTKLSLLGADAIAETLAGLEAGTLVPVPQDETLATHCRMLEKSDGYLDFSDSAEALSCRIRGVTPWPGAQTLLDGKIIKILEAEAVPGPAAGCPGSIHSLGDSIDVAAGTGILRILKLQEAGKKPNTAAEYLRGHPLQKGMCFEKLQ